MVDYSAGLAAILLDNYALAWLDPVIPLLGLAPLVLSTFCASDPPNVVALTQNEADAVLQFQFGTTDFVNGLGKIKDIYLNAVWWTSCDCTSGTLQPFPQFPMPAQTPVIQYTPTPSAQSCDSSTSFSTNQIGPGGGANSITGLGNATGAGTSVFLTMQNNVASGAGMVLSFTTTVSDALGSTLLTHTQSVNPGASATYTITLPSTWHTTRMDVSAVSGSGTSTYTNSQQALYCNGQYPGAQNPCCDPPAWMKTQLDNILQLVTLIQRNHVPFAYVPGAVHSGLSGAASFTIPSCIGVEINVTAMPADIHQLPGSPPYLWDLGWLSFSDGSGMLQEHRISRTNTVWIPPQGQLATTLGYYLFPGVTANITELYAET